VGKDGAWGRGTRRRRFKAGSANRTPALAPSCPLPQIGTIAFAFVCHHQTFLAWRSLKHATQRRFAITTHLALLGGLFLSLFLGITGA
jgi:hypothetical protein